MANEWVQRAGQEVEPGSWDQCLALLLSSGGGETLYRGHSRYDWRLESTLERALLEHAAKFDRRKHGLMESMSADPETDEWAKRVERALTQDFRRAAESYGVVDPPDRDDRLGWWEVMQHHGAPTRLMDWTTSPFVALWFAVDGHEEGDMALWVCDRRNSEFNHLDARAQLGVLESNMNLNEREQLNLYVEFALEDGNPALIPFQPRQFPRSVAQQSVLTVVPRIGVGRPAYLWIREKLATKVRVREEWRTSIMTACQSMGLSRHGLFRDLDSLGAFITRRFVDPPPGTAPGL